MVENRTVVFLAKVLLIAVIYCGAGQLGLSLAVPPGYATFIWPPSGIGLGALILYGWRLWPGILIGSVLLSSFITPMYTAEAGLDQARALTAVAVAIGSSLQALAGYALVKRLFGIPLQFTRIRDVLVLFFAVGPVVCMISPSIGVAALYLSGAVPAGELFDSWLTWWLGGIFGIVVFLPLVLIAPFGPQRLSWRGKALGNLQVTAMLILLIPLGLTFYAWKISSEATHDNGRIQFESLALESKKALLSRINSYENALLGGVAYFQGSHSINRHEWNRYVDVLDIKRNFPGINGLGWIASLAPKGVEPFLRTTRADGARNFAIHPEVDGDAHYVITYIEPEDVNRQALGLNIAFEENRKQAADLSRKTGKPAITKRIILVQDKEQAPGFLLLYPMYRDGFERGSSVERWAVFDGWIYAPFIAKKFMRNLTKSQGNTLSLRIYDEGREDPDTLIYESNKTQQKGPVSTYSKREHIEIMQQQWLVVWESTLGFEEGWRSYNPVLILSGGLLITFLSGLFLFVTTARLTGAVERTYGRQALVLPAFVFVVLAVGSVSLYRALNDKEVAHLKAMISSEISKIDLLINAESEAKLLALERMASRMQSAPDSLSYLWGVDARNYISDLAGLRAVAWVNAKGQMVDTQQSTQNDRLVWIDAIQKGAQADLAKAAVRKNMTLISPPVQLAGKEQAFIAYLPLVRNGASEGYLAAVFSVSRFFSNEILPETLDRYKFLITYDGDPQLEFGNLTQPVATPWALESTIQVPDKRWSIRIVPTKGFLNTQQTLLPDSALIAGMLIALLTAITAHMTLLSRLKTADLEASNERIKQEATRNSTVMNTVLDGVLTVSSEATIESINPAALRIFGYARGEVVGRNVNMLMPPDNDYIGHYLKTGEGLTIGSGQQVAARRKDGSIFPMDFSVNEMHLDGRRMLVSTLRDTSEAVAAARALSESNALKSAVMASTEYMIIATDLDGKVMVFNEAAEAALGYSAAEIVGKQTPALWHDDAEVEERARVLTTELGMPVSPGFETFTKRVDVKGIDENEWTFIHRDGTRFPVLLTGTALRNGEHETTGYLGVIVDLTKRKEIDRLKSDFVSIVSHELRTPLTSIRGALGLVMGAMSKELPDKALRLVDIAHKNCERLTLLINDILDIDKIASGQMRFEMKQQDLGSLLELAVDVNEPYAANLGVRIKSGKVDPDMAINVDPERFAQVMANLLSNAAKFSDSGDVVEVSARRHGEMVRVVVKDQGVGIAEEFRSQIFGKFLQSDSSSTRVKGGSGLGLHISKQIVERMGGVIGFETETGKGTTFWVDFPVPEPENPAGPVNGDEEQHLLLHYRQREVPALLHIEDDEDLSRILATYLHGTASVVTATTLKSAEALLRDKQFDLIVLDLGLPDGSGLEFLEKLTSLVEIPVPVMILSASEVSDQVKRKVASVMVKSRATEASIVQKIQHLMAA
ncbi:CHASE domain-containing protein [Hoeflea ulvae]|uniref:histidine kinase n=1 Tax=Hoeflea ulvae TaxID=2983764 RepID=A0ABT3YCN3_9HYPH|nr:CHASE domain-containing protein [Hoeflea ulvae]MCY0093646.1 CHASE domain-containing protein [Hoeflea ulvae]